MPPVRPHVIAHGAIVLYKIRKKNKNQPHVKLQPIGEWGTVIPFTDLKTDLKRTFEKIIEKYWNHLGGAY